MFWALQEVVPTLCKLRLGSACAITTPVQSWWVLGTCGSPISCCLHLHTWLLYRNRNLHGYNLDPLILFSSVASPACPSCWAQPELLPARQEPTLLHPAPECGLQHGQAGARGRYQGAGRMGGDPMTLSHDLSPPRAALMGLSLPRS